MKPPTKRLAGAAAIAVTAALAVAMSAPAQATPKDPHPSTPNGPTMDIQLLSFNDFHGNLEPPTSSSGRLTIGHELPKGATKPLDITTDGLPGGGVGGVEYLATHLANARKGHPYSLTVAAGDLIGASPLLSGAFHDEPTILAMNALKLDVSAVGNHEFDEGYQELQRMANGGCIDDGDGANNQNSCADGVFPGASFDYLAANVVKEGTDQTILPAYAIKNIKGAKIGFIGMTLKDTPSIVTAAGVAGLEFKDEVATANSLVPVLKKKGVNAIVVLIHQGGAPGQQTWYGPDNKPYTVSPSYDAACADGAQLDPTSPINPIAKGLDPAIDMVISGHTHQPYVCDIKDPAGNDRMVTSASSFGRLYTDTTLTYDRRTQDIVRTSVKSENMLVTRDVAKDPAETAIIERFKELVAPIANRVLGQVVGNVTRAQTAAGESQLGDLIADAQLADPSVVGPSGAAATQPDIAFMNPGGIRGDLGHDDNGNVTFADAFAVQPFNNYLVSASLTGAQIKDLLVEQWSGANANAPKVLQVSDGFAYSYSASSKSLVTVTLNGTPLDDATTYRVVTNNFLIGGGDGFPTFLDAKDVYYGGLDIDAFANYLQTNSPYTPGALTRITVQ
ncbi:bifunctional metallophosphatase/5'-nucleotidase [Microbacterium sp.]|uniref:bifunctional metallophosphatase/5'-nucleotidase n=1 Tax=Microbacterium sp. TaxID=51671 RepID=UPI003A8D5FF6